MTTKLDEIVRLGTETFGSAVLETPDEMKRRAELALEAGESGPDSRPFLYLSGEVGSDEDWERVVDFHMLLEERGLVHCVHAVLRTPDEY